MDFSKTIRTVLLVCVTVVTGIVLLYVQSKFNEADRKAAIRIVQEYQSKQGRSIPEILQRQFPNDFVAYSATTESSCFQHVRVRASVTNQGSLKATYDFMIDINSDSIHPADRNSESILAQLDQAALQ